MNPRPLTVAIALIGAAVAGGMAIGGWVFWSARTAADVAVSWSPKSPTCTGTSVERSGSKRPIIDAKAKMRCVITVRVANGSGHTVHVTRAIAPIVGPRTGAVVRAENARPSTQDGGVDIDAVYPLAHDLAGGKSLTFDVVLVLNPDGCNENATLWASNWPTVTIDALGREHDLHGDKDFAFHREGATPGCHH